MKTIGILALVTGALTLLFGVIAAALAIWTGDDRWDSTAILAFFVGFAVACCGAIAVES